MCLWSYLFFSDSSWALCFLLQCVEQLSLPMLFCHTISALESVSDGLNYLKLRANKLF